MIGYLEGSGCVWILSLQWRRKVGDTRDGLGLRSGTCLIFLYAPLKGRNLMSVQFFMSGGSAE